MITVRVLLIMLSAPRLLELYFPLGLHLHANLYRLLSIRIFYLPSIMDWSLQGFCYSDVIPECTSNNGALKS